MAVASDVPWIRGRLQKAKGRGMLEQAARFMLKASRTGSLVCNRSVSEVHLLEAFKTFPDLDLSALD